MAGDHYLLELEPPEERLRHAPHVVIVGGGFAGIQACQALAKSEVRITLIDKRNLNLFQPFLYQVAPGLVASGDIALNAADAHFPMQLGLGPSIASPDAALRAAMEYYSKEIAGMSTAQKSNTQELIDTNGDSAADSAAAIK